MLMLTSEKKIASALIHSSSVCNRFKIPLKTKLRLFQSNVSFTQRAVRMKIF